MNYGFQRYNINRALSSKGIETERFDVHAHIDRRLSMGENIRNIEHMHGLNVGSATRQYREAARRTSTREARGEFYQIGRTHQEQDRKLNAKSPGMRRSQSGRRYVERRKNRSDRPGLRI